MFQKSINEKEAIAIRAMHLQPPEKYTEFEGERIYGWTAFDENEVLINLNEESDYDVVMLFYSHLGVVDE